MKQSDVPLIARQIVSQTAYQKGRQLNTYRNLTSPPKMTDSAFGASVQDYEAGQFWSRDWVAAGADPNTIRGGFPVLFSEARGGTFSADTIEVQQEWYFMVLDQVQCDTCPDRHIAEVQRDSLQMLRHFVTELLTYEKWTVEKDGENFEMWISRQHAMQIDAHENSPITLLELQEDALEAIMEQVYEFREFIPRQDEHPAFNVAGYSVKVSITTCEPIGVETNYEDPNYETLGMTPCTNC